MRLETSKPSGQERGRWVVGIWWMGERQVGGGECGERGERRSGEGWGWWQGPSTTSAVGQPGCCTALPLQGASWVELSHPGSMGLDPRPQALSWGQGGVGGGVTAGGPPSVQFSSVVSDSLRPHRLQHTRPPCPLPTPRVYSNSCPLSLWCHTTTSSSAIPFSPCLQSFPASRSFQMSQFFASGGQSIGVSASTLVLPMNIQDWFPLGWTGWISLQSLKSLLQHHSSKASILWHSAFFIVQLHTCNHTWPQEKP